MSAKKKTAKKAAKKTANKKAAKKAVKKAAKKATKKVTKKVAPPAPPKPVEPDLKLGQYVVGLAEAAKGLSDILEKQKKASKPSIDVPAFASPSEKQFENPTGPTPSIPVKKKAVKSEFQKVKLWVVENTEVKGQALAELVDQVYDHHRRGLIVLSFMDGSGKQAIHRCEHSYEQRDRVRGAAARFSPKSFLHECICKK